MNVIVSNKNAGLLESLDVEIIKTINGEFTADEIIGTFSNFFFNRMFLDITALKDYTNISNIQKLSINLDMDKVIFLLDNKLMSDTSFLSKLISMGIYNFANNKESLMYLYELACFVKLTTTPPQHKLVILPLSFVFVLSPFIHVLVYSVFFNTSLSSLQLTLLKSVI